MDLSLVISMAAFAALAFVGFAVMTLLNQGDNRAAERLDELNTGSRDRNRGEKSTGVSAAIQNATPVLSSALQPKSELEQNELKIRLANAGYNHPLAGQFYLSIKFVSLLIGAVLGGGYGMFTYGLSQSGMTTLGLAAGLGFYIPEIVLWWIRSKRMQAIFLSLPDALDLLVVCVEAGLGLDAAMRRVCDELEDVAPELCREMQLCNLQIQMGRTRRDVLHDFGTRTGVDDVKALMAILIQAEKFGSSIAQALRVQSDSMRVKRRQIAEEKAQKTAVQMLFPLVLFIFPGIFVVLVGPAAIKMVDQLLK